MSKNKPLTSASRRHRPVYKRPLFWLGLVLVAVLTFFAFRYFSSRPSAPENSSVPASTTSETKPAVSKSDDAEKSETSSLPAEESDGKTPEQYEGSNPNLEASLSGSLTTARFDGDKLVLRVSVDQYLSSGTCTLELSDGTHTLTKTAAISPIASSSSCEGFDVAASELSDFSRPLSVKINLASGDKAGLIEGSVE